MFSRLIQTQGTHSAAATELRPVKLEPMIPVSILPRQAGSVLLYGRQGHYEHNVCVDLALATALATGGPTVVLTGRDDQSQLPGLVIAWRNARNIPVGTRLRIILGISARKQSSTPKTQSRNASMRLGLGSRLN